jgi:hypothetical protein
MNPDIEIQTHEDGTIIATMKTEEMTRQFIKKINPKKTFQHCGTKYNLLKYVKDSVELNARVQFDLYIEFDFDNNKYINMMHLKIVDDVISGGIKLCLQETYDSNLVHRNVSDNDTIKLLRGEITHLKEINECVTIKLDEYITSKLETDLITRYA